MIRAFLPLGFLLAMVVLARADVLKGLSAADQARVKSGEQVIATEPLDGYPWPRVIVYQLVEATPKDVIAVFTDYNNACKFVPNCLKSQIAKKVDLLTYDVDYVIDVPILPDEAYTVRDTLTQEPNGALRVSWKLLKATSILETQGNIYVEPLTDSTSILRYTNLVKPSSGAAVILKGMALSQMKETIRAIVARVAEQKADPASFKPLLQHVDTALGAR